MAGVDGTMLQRFVGVEQFDVVVFNFPHAGTFNDSASKITCSDHGALLDGLFGSVRSALAANGCFCLALLKSQFARWQVQQRASNQGYRLVSHEMFDRTSFSEYRPVWGDDRDFTRASQPWQIYSGEEPRIYRFQLKQRSAPTSTANPTGIGKSKPVEAALEAVIGTVCDEAPLFCHRMLRLVDKPSLPKMEREFQSKLALRERYPLLSAWLQARQDLELTRHLAVVLDWVRFVQHHFAFKVARDESRMTVYQALQKLENQSNEFGQMPPQASQVTAAGRGRQLFDRFCAAWAECRAAGSI